MRLASVLVLLVALGLCTGAAFADPRAQLDEKPWSYDFGQTRLTVPEVEPNDTCPTGQIIQCGDVVDPAQIATGTDLDWYTLQNVAGGTVITVGTDASSITPTPGLGDSFIELWYNCGAARVAYDDDSGPGAYSLMTYTVPAGSPGTYTIKVRGYSASYTGYYKVSVSCQVPEPPPVNDTCAGAIELTRCTAGSVNGTLQWATNNYDPAVPGPSCTGYAAAGKDVTYKVALEAGDGVTLTYTPTGYDASLYIVSDCSNMATCVAGSDLCCSGTAEPISWVCPTTGTYYIICDGYGTNVGGAFTLAYDLTCVPPAEGACCSPATGACTLAFEANCLTPNVWHGEWTSCDPNQCPQPILGACCHPTTGACVLTAQTYCLSPSIWHGEWTSCDTNPCPQPPAPPENDTCAGAILLPQCGAVPIAYSGDATWAVNDYSPGAYPSSCTGYTAVGQDVVYMLNLLVGDTFTVSYTRTSPGDASIYLVTDCANTVASCVIGADATVTGGTETFTYTSVAGGTYYLILDAYSTAGGPWTMTYTPPACPGVPGSCCYPDGLCAVTTLAGCTGGIWTEAGVCDPNTCPQPPIGSCCYGNGTCALTTQIGCTATWLLAGVCDPNTCAPPATGACCNIVIGFPACTITTQAGCVAPLVWLGGGVLCNVDTCTPPNPVERTSWGQIKNNYR